VKSDQEGVRVEAQESKPNPNSLAELEPGMQLAGKVTKVELFGAFVDVGLDREGLVHISMISPQHVRRVEDVVQEGAQVTVWVHKADPQSGRLELTMVKPLALQWGAIKPGLKLKGEVVRVEGFGAFVDIGAERPGLVHVSEMSHEYVSNPADVVKPGQAVEVKVLEVDRKKRQIRLSMKEAEEEVVEVEEEHEEAIPTAMEVALRKAMSADTGDDAESSSARANTGKKARALQEELLSRTLRDRLRTGAQEK
jgi:small subunit ribosomal protein S1